MWYKVSKMFQFFLVYLKQIINNVINEAGWKLNIIFK